MLILCFKPNQTSTIICLDNLIFYSGQVHIISSDHDESDEDFVAAASPPRIDHVPNTKELQVRVPTCSTEQVSTPLAILIE